MEPALRVLVTIGDQRDPAELGPLPAAVRVERLVSQAELMPHTAVMVGHGGSGSTLAALAALRHRARRRTRVRPPARTGRARAIERRALRDRARASADEIQTLPPVEQAPDALSAPAA